MTIVMDKLYSESRINNSSEDNCDSVVVSDAEDSAKDASEDISSFLPINQ